MNQKLKVFDALARRLRPGGVYRRQDLAQFSSNIDRHLKRLLDEGTLEKLKNGLYACPRKSTFGDVPPSEKKLLRAFLKSSNFAVYSPSVFNSLGFGTTQLYAMRVVLNQKRAGNHELGGWKYYFRRWLKIPRTLTREVLVVELLNGLKRLAEDPDKVLEGVKKKLASFDKEKLSKASTLYGTYSTQLKLDQLLSADTNA